MSDYYSILGVESNATPESIQERFRFLAQAFHPDRYASLKQKQLAEEEFKKISEAYEVLSNPKKRADYDLKRKQPFNYSRTNTNNTNIRTKEATRSAEKEELRKKAEEAARKRAQEEKRRRSKQWIEANQTKQKGAKLRGVDLRNGYLEEANFEDADLRDANLNGAWLCIAKLARANLTNSTLIYAWLCTLGDNRAADATRSTLRGANLKHARLSYVDFSDADLENANFTNAVMSSVNFRRANLKGADLSGASLSQADFTDAILVNSNLSRTDLSDAILTGAKLENTVFKESGYTNKTIWPKNITPDLVGAIPMDVYWNNRIYKWAQERIRDQEKQRMELLKESQKSMFPHFPVSYCRRLMMSLGPLSSFVYTSSRNRIIGTSPTGCSTLELDIAEDFFRELVFRVDYVHENSFARAQYLVDVVAIFLESNKKLVLDWFDSIHKSDSTSISDMNSREVFDDCQISFLSKHREGIREYSFKPIKVRD